MKILALEKEIPGTTSEQFASHLKAKAVAKIMRTILPRLGTKCVLH